MMKKVLVAMSGGVDSSVAAFLLVEAGYAVTGVTMCLGSWEEGERARCCGKDAVDDARAVCDVLGISHHVIDFAETLKDTVIDKFIREYSRGRTPNPCIDCNRYLKFGKLLNMARAIGFDYLATGHYARIEGNGDGYRLMKAKDSKKDQTYFLYPIRKDDLPNILFPLGDYTKGKVRVIAKESRLPVAGKVESQDICFVTGKGYGRFFRETGGMAKPGSIVDMTGRKVGRHEGIAFYTVGQRHGLGIAAREPLYVTFLDSEKNRIVVGSKSELKASVLIAGDFNSLVEKIPECGEAKIRYRKKASECTLSPEGDRIRVVFHDPQESITPGQAIVIYRDDEVLGGGVIEEVIHGTR
jgi:tRNA-uridine 2-sulfurtransferase